MANQNRKIYATAEQVVEARGSLTQMQVAEQLRVSLNAVQNWERARAPISKTAWMAMQNSNKSGH